MTTTAPESTTTPSTTPPVASVGTVVVSRTRFDADGNDNQNKNDEWVEMTNEGAGPVDLTGWRLEDEGPNHVFRFPAGFVLDPDSTVTVFSGCGNPTVSQQYFCNSGSAVWNNGGDIATLFDANGVKIDSSS
jgi:hypothetical protein